MEDEQLSMDLADPWSDVSKPNTPPSFERDDEEEPKEIRTPMCGDGIRKLLSSKSPMRAPARKTNTYSRVSTKLTKSEKQSLLVDDKPQEPRNGKRRMKLVRKSKDDESITEGRLARSPSAESNSSEKEAPKNNRKFFSEFFASVASGKDGESNEMTPYYVLQFNRSSSVDSLSPRKKKQDQEDRQESTFPSGGGQPQMPNHHHQQQRMPIRAKRRGRSSSWSSALPSVMEESSSADDTSTAASGTLNNQDEESSQPSEIVVAMKDLVRKQQRSIEHMEKENKQFKEELAEYRELLSEAKHDRTKQEDKIGQLTVEKKTSESETLWLREEMKTLKAEIAKMKEENQLKMSMQIIPRASTSTSFDSSKSDPEVVQFEEMKKAIYGNLLEADSLLKSESEDSITDSSLFLDEKRDDTTATSSGFSLSETSRQDVDHRSSCSSRLSGNGSMGHLENMEHQSAQDSNEAPQTSATRSKEEVSLFKSRLEAIQKKREERKIRESDFGSRSGRVRFD